MFTNIYSGLASWLGTSAGVATVLTIVVIGLVLSALFVGVLYNLYMELVQVRSDSVKQVSNLESDVAKMRTLLQSKEFMVSDLEKKVVEENSRTQYYVNKYKGADDQLVRLASVEKERDRGLEDLGKEIVLRERLEGDISVFKERIRSLDDSVEAAKILNTNLEEMSARLTNGLIQLGGVLRQSVATKVVALKSFGFNFAQQEDTPLQLRMVNIPEDEAPNFGFDSGHNFASLNPAAPDTGIVSRVIDQLLNVPESYEVGPVYFAQVLYIRALDLKIVLTDYPATPLRLTDENREPLTKFLDTISSPSVIRSSKNILILDRHVWEALNGDPLNSFLFSEAEDWRGLSLYRVVENIKGGTLA